MAAMSSTWPSGEDISAVFDSTSSDFLSFFNLEQPGFSGVPDYTNTPNEFPLDWSNCIDPSLCQSLGDEEYLLELEPESHNALIQPPTEEQDLKLIISELRDRINQLEGQVQRLAKTEENDEDIRQRVEKAVEAHANGMEEQVDRLRSEIDTSVEQLRTWRKEAIKVHESAAESNK